MCNLFHYEDSRGSYTKMIPISGCLVVQAILEFVMFLVEPDMWFNLQVLNVQNNSAYV
jgi:hypothetical protein